VPLHSPAPPTAVQRIAPAKVNLSLRVTGRRADGYHELDGLIAFAGVGDVITVRRAEGADGPSLELAGPFATTLAGEGDNLVLRAARTLAEAARRTADVHVVLDKQLPVAAGLGGGSADAAAALSALAELWGLRLSAHRLHDLALSLGADVPICLYGKAAFVSGIGETIGPAPHLPPAWLVLANPGVGLTTAEVFGARAREAAAGFSPPAHRWDAPPRDAGALARHLAKDGNDLEAPARRLRPEIDRVLATLEHRTGCLLARMSGSGATCFGLFAEAGSAEAAAAQIGAEHPGWWVRAARLSG
jgi:4-diphosphocytidyl-2-C-methyl-D-erythritol kinase